MDYKKITSTSNEQVKRFSKISSSSQFAKKEGLLFLDGHHLCQEFFNKFGAGDVEVVLVDQDKMDQKAEGFLENFDNKKIILVSAEVMKKISVSETPQGISLIGIRPNTKSERLNLSKILVLENVSDPGNVGTILRTAAATGFDAIYLSKGCADIWSQKVLRSAQGAHFYIDIKQDFELSEIKETFKGKLYGTVLDDKAKSLYDSDISGDIGFVLGNEGSGLTEEGKAICDEPIYIPMQNGFESLNVAVAAAMCMGEKMRQNWQ